MGDTGMASDEVELIFRWMQQHDDKMDAVARKQDALAIKLDNHIATQEKLAPAINELNDLWRSSKALSKLVIPVLTLISLIGAATAWILSHIRYH
jgi:phage-related minor tail protein